jgi:hypothetical protein
VTALGHALDGRVGLAALLDDLRYRARPALLPRLLGRAVRRAYAFDRYDQADRRWWPQGVTTSADASDDGTVAGSRRVVVVSWYAHEVDGIRHGSRLTFLDLDTLRYRHVLLVEPVVGEDGSLGLRPLPVHAGGLVWHGEYLHVAATSAGFVSARVADLLRVPGDDGDAARFGVDVDGVATYGFRYVLPVSLRHVSRAEEGTGRLRHSFLSLDRSGDPRSVLVGEYGRTGQSTRLARFALDPATTLPATDEGGIARPTTLADAGVRQMQGVAMARGRHHLTVSHGPWRPGALVVGEPGDWRRHERAVPMGPEDLSYWPATDTLWTVTEHPWRRWLCAVPRARLDR